MLKPLTLAAAMVFYVVLPMGDAVGSCAFGESYLVKDGRVQAEIVLGEKPGRVAKLAARELQSHVEQITGAGLRIVSKPSGQVPVKVFLGKNACPAGLNLSTDGLAHGAFRMASGAGWLALLGTDWEFTPIEPWPRNRADNARVEAEWDKITGDTFDFHLMSEPRSPYAGVPVYFPREIAEDLHSLKGVSLGDYMDVANSPNPERYSWNSLAVEHLNCYVTSRFWWNADQDLDTLLEDCRAGGRRVLVG